MKTIIEFAASKHCSRQTVYAAIKSGRLKSTRKFGKQLVPETAANQSWQPESKKAPDKFKIN